MKNIQRVILLIVATTVFLTGMGVTVINFCCPSCSEQTLFMTKKHVCCSEKAESNTVRQTKSCCSGTATIDKGECHDSSFSKAGHCSPSRLVTDKDASSFRPQISSPFVWLSETLTNALNTTLPNTVGDAKDYTHLKIPSTIPPREYLSLIRVLII